MTEAIYEIKTGSASCANAETVSVWTQRGLGQNHKEACVPALSPVVGTWGTRLHSRG